MNNWIYFTIVLLFLNFQATSESSRVLDIKGNERNAEIPTWIYDTVNIVARSTLVEIWNFNHTTAALVEGPIYIYPNTSLINVIANVSSDSFLVLSNITRIYTGNYEAIEDTSSYSLDMTVHGK
jgi:hypothetical protein